MERETEQRRAEPAFERLRSDETTGHELEEPRYRRSSCHREDKSGRNIHRADDRAGDRDGSGGSHPATLGGNAVARQGIAANISNSMAAPIRILTAVPICDGHDSAINTINLEFIRHGIEVVYLGYHRYAEDIVRAAIQEDVRAIGISSYNGGHVEFFAEVVRQLKKRGADDIKVFGGGGGTITHDDQRVMQKRGIDQIFFAGTSLSEMVEWVRKRYGKRPKRRATSNAEMKLARKLTEIEDGYANGKRAKKKTAHRKSKFK